MKLNGKQTMETNQVYTVTSHPSLPTWKILQKKLKENQRRKTLNKVLEE
jgi:hypothetical protein